MARAERLTVWLLGAFCILAQGGAAKQCTMGDLKWEVTSYEYKPPIGGYSQVIPGECTSLEVNRNNVGVEGAKALAEALKTNTALTSLDLYRNSVGDEGAKALAESLKTNTALTSLNLNWNSVGDEGGQGTS